VTTLDEVMEDLRQRDARDSARAEAPLRPAEDALMLDTSEMTIEQAVAAAVAAVDAARG
jgi:cytidylate kinase